MNFSQFFIQRPIFAAVLSLLILIGGAISLFQLPISEYPEVVPPTVVVRANFPGANPKVIGETVASPLEQAITGVENMLYMSSQSTSDGKLTLTITFALGTDLDNAQVQVQNRVTRTEPKLPEEVTRLGITVDKASPDLTMVVHLTSPDNRYDMLYLSNYAVLNVKDELARLDGVGDVQLFGLGDYSLRVWLDPNKVASRNLTATDVVNAIREQNRQVAAGTLGAPPAPSDTSFQLSINTQGRLVTEEEFENIIIRAGANGEITRLRDIARVELGSNQYALRSLLNNKPAVAIPIFQRPGSNAIEISNLVREKMAELKHSFPQGMDYSIVYDPTIFVRGSIEAVVHTLFEALVLVVLVVILFLQTWRASIIPLAAVPVSLIGTFAVMHMLGFSLNALSLFGLVLAIGIVVDDAIVVVENVERIMAEEGISPAEATVKAMKQVSGAIVGITLVLSAVFLPLAFMAGSVGVIYQQFSVSLAVSILFSGFLALTFTPALCATLLKPIPEGHHEKRGFFGAFNRGFARVTERYSLLNSKLVARAGRFMLVYAGLVAMLGYFYLRLPEAFVPAEDLGYMVVDVQLPPGASRVRTDATGEELERFLKSREAVASVFLISGFSFSGQGDNAALAFPTFKDWSERGAEQSAAAEIAALNEHFALPDDGTIMAVSPPPINGLGNSGGFALRLMDRSGVGREALLQARDTLLGEIQTNPKFLYAMMEGLAEAPQLRLLIDREKARALGVSFETISGTLSAAFGSEVINDFTNAGRQQRVVIQAEQGNRMTPESVLELYVPNAAGNLVPLSAFVSVKWEEGPVQLVRYNGYPSIRIVGDAAPGFSTGEAMAEMERLAAQLPAGIGYEWTGLSYQEKVSAGQATSLFALAILVVFLLLVALYESWSIPLSVMLIVPIGAIGAVLAVMVSGMSNDVYFKVGLITIIGLSAKNAILIVEFAKELWEQGHSLRDASIEAARLRFRPIIMTSMAFILGVIPLALASGAGAASQRAIGTGVIGGMLSATFLGVLFVPICFVWLLSLLRSKPAPIEQAASAGE
ncbi:TPA: multidrug efflux RND transporter permease subunit [Pseudomonas aeruginosa]|nr:multidrug efflux RND transporter permease subunit [Pseudomonas aeruginosa]